MTMSYQVLARKWRPSTFDEMVGQTHVLKALVNALDQQRLHHAYLFTGTRGVGKTTIARLLAKSLNCEVGIGSTPCGRCASCLEIAEGRFVDLIEVDAASRTKVEDTRELLENVQYSPTRGRFKVYLIDEVHMLSTSSFNALLKTLEEPPPYVKFLLATTDPQKLPVTVLSRCLQFNLKNMSREHIVQHLSHILGVEQIAFDEPSLWAIAEGAQGSMRDALSLTDQAIAFGQGVLREQEVAAMLGTVDLKRVLRLTAALFEKKIDQLLALVAEIDEHAPDYQALMTELMSTLHRVAIAQAAPTAIDNNKGDRDAIVQLAAASAPEDVHLYYQIGGKAKTEMAFAPSQRAGFEMALLRMLAFSLTPAANVGALPELTSQAVIAQSNISSAASVSLPDTGCAPVNSALSSPVPMTEPAQPETPAITSVAPAPEASEAALPIDTAPLADTGPEPELEPEPTVMATMAVDESTQVVLADEPTAEATASVITRSPQIQTTAATAAAGAVTTSPLTPEVGSEPVMTAELEPSSIAAAAAAEPAEPERSAPPVVGTVSVDESAPPERLSEKAHWPETDLASDPVFWWQVNAHRLGLSGMVKTVFANSEWQDFDGETLTLAVSTNYQKIMNDNYQRHLLEAIPARLSGCRKLQLSFGAVSKTPALWLEQLVQKANNQAFDYLSNDPFIQQLSADYNGQLDRESSVPNHNPIPSGA